MRRLLRLISNMKLFYKFLSALLFVIVLSITLISVFVYKVYEKNIYNNTITYTNNLVKNIVNNVNYKAREYEKNIANMINQTKIFLDVMNNEELEALERLGAYENFSMQLTIMEPAIQEIYIESAPKKADKNRIDLYPDTKPMFICYSNNRNSSTDYKEAEIYQFMEENRLGIRMNMGAAQWVHLADEPEIIYVARAVYDISTSDYLGIIALGIDKADFSKLSADLSNNKNGAVIIYNNHKEILSCENSLLDLAGFIGEAIDPEVMNEKWITYEREKYLITGAISDNSKWIGIYVISRRDLYKSINPIRLWILMVGIILFIVSFGIAYFISLNITHNIRILLKKIEAVEQGNFTAQIETNSRDEIGQLAVKFNDMVARLGTLIENITKEKLSKQQSELKALEAEFYAMQAQINPHFLYNALESINSYAKLDGNSDIEKIIVSLSKLLRASISNKKPLIKFREEIQYIKSYLLIQKIILGDRLETEYEIDEGILDYEVPKLILQPIVENSIIHGIERRRELGIICITANAESDNLVIKVSDNGNGIEASKLAMLLNGTEYEDDSKHTHIGIQSVDKRIKILYGEEYGLEVTSKVGMGTVVNIIIPLQIQEKILLNN